MNIQELGTVHSYEIGVKIVILNNQHLGMVAQWEDRFYGSRRGNTVLSNKRSNRPYPDFVTIAKGYLIPGREVYKKSELADAIREMLETPGRFYWMFMYSIRNMSFPCCLREKAIKILLQSRGVSHTPVLGC